MRLTRHACACTLAALMTAECGGASSDTTAAPARAATTSAAPGNVGKIERIDPAFDALVAPAAAIERVAGGFKFTEGPLWRPDGTLWFSDVPGNVVRSLTRDGKVTVLIENAGGAANAPPDAFVGSNGMAEAPEAARRQPSPSVLMRSRLATGRRHAARQGAVRDSATIGRPYLNSNGARSRRYRRQTRQWCAPSVSMKVCLIPACSSA